MSAELVVAAGAELGEGPTVFPDGSVWWVDLLTGRTFRWLDGVHEVGPSFEHEVAKVLPCNRGALVIGREDIRDISGRVVARIASRQSNLRGSDSAVLPDGSLVYGLVDRDLSAERGSLNRLAQGETTVIARGASIPNGIAVMPDGRRVVWTDSPTMRLDMFDLDSDGVLRNRRPFAVIPEGYGVPDGLCVDADGGVWVAMWGGGQVVRFDSTGDLDTTIAIGTPYVTSCAFDHDDALIVTTAAVTLTPEERERDGGAGGLWRIARSVHGAQRAATYIANVD